MRIKVARWYFDKDQTIGKLYIDNVPECFTLEDQVRSNDIKVKGETAIPTGEYKLAMHPNKQGRFYTAYTERWGDPFNAGVPHLLDVPNFTNVLIHTGVVDEHTAGCLLVGKQAQINLDGSWNLVSSRIAYHDLYLKIFKAIEAGEATIEVTNGG